MSLCVSYFHNNYSSIIRKSDTSLPEIHNIDRYIRAMIFSSLYQLQPSEDNIKFASQFIHHCLDLLNKASEKENVNTFPDSEFHKTKVFFCGYEIYI